MLPGVTTGAARLVMIGLFSSAGSAGGVGKDLVTVIAVPPGGISTVRS